MAITKLSPNLKFLLAQRSPSPPPMTDSHKLDKACRTTLRNLQDGVKGEDGTLRSWLAVATSTFISVNIDHAVAMSRLYTFATNVDLGSPSKAKPVCAGEKANRVNIMREAGLKCAVLAGIPKTINSLGALRQAVESDVLPHLDQEGSSSSSTSPLTVEEISQRGEALFSKIYDPVSEKLLHKLSLSHPDFPQFILTHAYGGLLSKPPLSRTITSAIAVACLRAQGGVGPQLTSHVFGLLKASEEPEELGCQTTAERWLASEAGVEWVLDTTDQLCDALSSKDVSRL